jgi:hypothetical protein
MNMENMNAQWGEVGVELSMDELALVNGGSVWGFIKDAANWVANHADDIKKGVDTVQKVVDVGKKVISWIGSIF